MAIVTFIKKKMYQDSIKLMLLSNYVRGLDGVVEASVMMATPTNLELLQQIGLLTEEAQAAAPEDILIVIKAIDEKKAEAALHIAEGELIQRRPPAFSGGKALLKPPRTLEAGLREMPGANFALISVPGRYAAHEARKALDLGLHVMIFSDNVPLSDEIDLKRRARAKHLMVMGPDCGTAIINGFGLGFANVIRRGSIGIIGASGSGIQEVSVLIDRYGGGISHAIGTGGRDLNPEVGGITMLQGFDLLEKDNSTEILVLISKPPDSLVAKRIFERAGICSKPVVLNFLERKKDISLKRNVLPAWTLEEAALRAVGLTKKMEADSPQEATCHLDVDPYTYAPGQRFLRGFYAGGTFAYETMLILEKELAHHLYSNTPLPGGNRLATPWKGYEHSIIDLGDDRLTQGRPHPMIDPEIRNRLLLEEVRDPTVAVILMDVILGYGAHPDPGGVLSPVIKLIKSEAKRQGRCLTVLVHVCGTEGDPQGLSNQEAALREAGAILCETNAQMARTGLKVALRLIN